MCFRCSRSANNNENDLQTVYQEFKEQFNTNEAGWFGTKLPWKGNPLTLSTSEVGNKHRLNHLVRKLEKTDQYERYDEIIRQQLKDEIIEAAPRKEFTFRQDPRHKTTYGTSL